MEIIFLVLVIYLFKKTLPAYKECYRINMIQFSPIVSFFQETFNGNSVIRAFKKEEQSNARVVDMLNRNCLSNSITTAVWSWYSIRVDLLSMLVLSAGCSCCIFLKSNIKPVLLSLMLQYLL